MHSLVEQFIERLTVAFYRKKIIFEWKMLTDRGFLYGDPFEWFQNTELMCTQLQIP